MECKSLSLNSFVGYLHLLHLSLVTKVLSLVKLFRFEIRLLSKLFGVLKSIFTNSECFLVQCNLEWCRIEDEVCELSFNWYLAFSGPLMSLLIELACSRFSY